MFVSTFADALQEITITTTTTTTTTTCTTCCPILTISITFKSKYICYHFFSFRF